MVKNLLPKRHDVVHGTFFSCSLHALKNTIKLEVVGANVVGKSFHSLVGAEHLDEFLVFKTYFWCKEEVLSKCASSYVGLKEFPAREAKS
jgi:hypothetical protein